jgi:hypothetical protein
METDALPPTKLKVEDNKGNNVDIQHVSNKEAVKYLGCWKAPKGQDQEKQALMSKCATFARVINCSYLTRKETKYFYDGIYKPCVGYSLPLTYFKFQELDKIQRKVHEAMITHCGFNRNTAKEVIYGVQQWGGAAFTHLYDTQGYGQIAQFIKSWCSPHTHQGKMLRIALYWAQYCTGVSFPILETTNIPLHQVEAEWILSLRRYLHDIQGQLQN